MLPLVAPDLRTERLRLRPLATSDVAALSAYQGDANVVRYLPYGPRSRTEVAEFVLRFAGARELRVDSDRVVYAILPDAALASELAVDVDSALGELHVVLHSSVSREFELGWVLHPRAQRRGIAGEAAGAAADLLFARGAHRVRAVLDPRNTASAALCERLGMRQEAVHRQDFPDADGWSDTAVWAVLDTDRAPGT